MLQTECLNLCEILPILYRFDSTYERSIPKACDVCGITKLNRIYIGSSFCGNYFIHLNKDELIHLEKWCQKHTISITLVLPIFGQSLLTLGKEKIEFIMKLFDGMITEITVNDYGMLSYIAREYKKSINIGRLFNKDYRDPRMKEYYKQTRKPFLITDYFQDLRKQYPIIGIEFDVTHAKIDLSDIPDELQIAVHCPYTYATVGQICQFASNDYAISSKFRPNQPCNLQCMDSLIMYDTQEDIEWIKLGRTVYFKQNSSNIIGKEKMRVIYFPIEWEVMQCTF